jgi:hypothetical protein
VPSRGANSGARKIATLPEGSTATSIEIDMSKVPPPERSYFAELAGVEYENGSVNFLFGQSTRDNKIRSMIEISMSPYSVIQALRSIEALNAPSLADIVQKQGDASAVLSAFKEEPPEVARIKANIMTFAFADSEASIEYFYISPFSVANLNKRLATSVDVQGVVRIDTQTILVEALRQRLIELIPQFSASVRDLWEIKI